ncbi:Pkinase-domain-containing protein [Thermothelomyces heterothallicus CBS 203.75]
MMDPYGDSQPTQPTQTVADPKRLGQLTSGFSDEEVSDIICLLLPYSEAARQEVRRMAAEASQHMVGREDVDNLRVDYTREDDLRRFGGLQSDVGEHHIALRFSSQIKDPSQGFTFGRHPGCCDICLRNDPHRRLSKIHFRIFLNQWGVLMLEDMSTNGTVVDDVLLKKKDGVRTETTRTLESGSKIQILMHEPGRDLSFLVRIPIRDGACEEAYKRNLDAYLAKQLPAAYDANETIVPGPGGHVDIFKPPPAKQPTGNGAVAARRAQVGAKPASRSRADALPRPWNGSDKYKRVCEIGRGAFATVHKVTLRHSGQPFAAKELDKRKFMKNGVLDQKVENEMRIMRKIKHPNIVEYIEHLDWDDRLLIIIMEFVGGGDLGRLIAENGPLSESATKTMARQLLDALGYLHDMNITHRDVKPDNILVDSLDPFVVKLTDFGLSKMVDNEQTFLRTFCGTLLYCAPEVYSEYAEYDNHGRRHPRNRRLRPATGQRYDHAVDVWSLGGVLFYALTKRPPFPARNGASHSELLHQIMTKPLDISPLIEAEISEEGIDFLRRMLDRRPETRATVSALQEHPWISGSFTTVAQSFDEAADEELHVNASQLSLDDNQRGQGGCRELRVPSDDEISDDEDVDFDAAQPADYESEKENYTFGPDNRPQRLFGEVGPSAVRSTGAVASNRLNLPISPASFGSTGTTEILGNETEIKDSFESEDQSTPRQKPQKSQTSPGLVRQPSLQSAGQSRSVDELNNMTFDVASQSLGGAESILENLNMKSRAGSLLRSHATGDLNSSKRKPPSDSGEEDNVPVPAKERRGLKRLRAAASAKLSANHRAVEDGEYELLAQMPSILRAQSGRQIDNPVHKSTYWSAQDRRTWHLNYPEMTQLQLDAFKTAASAREEEFGPGKTPLWDLAMKYFPPTNCERRGAATEEPADHPENGVLPSTAGADATVPATPPPADDPGPLLVMPMQSDPGRPVVACLQSAPGSAIPGVSIMITESMVSWGRANENTRSYPHKYDLRVPKYAFRILLWKQDYDPAKNFRPWNRAPEADEKSFHFYISTKATAGIHVNGVHLPSDDAKNPANPSTYWMALYDGDRVSVSQTPDRSVVSELIFRCGWGGSAKSRASLGLPRKPELAPEAVASKLDEVCVKTERKVRSLSEHDLKMEEANHDVEERMRRVDRERQRSREFEARRLEACRALGIRRVSPAPGITLGEESATQTPWSSYVPGTRTVPTYRHASPATLELLRAAKRG